MLLLNPYRFVPSDIPAFLLPLFAAMSPEPDEARSNLIIDLGQGLFDAGIWVKLDSFWAIANFSEQSAQLNWIDPANNVLAPQASPDFTIDEGYQGNGSSSYVNTNYTPGGGQYQQNSASIFGWAFGSVPESGTADFLNITGGGRSAVIRMFGAPSTSGSFGVNSLGSTGATYSPPEGLFTARRLTGTDVELFQGAAQLVTNPTGASGVPTQQMTLLCAVESGTPTRFSSKRIAFAGAGAGLTDTEISDLNDLCTTWLGAI